MSIEKSNSTLDTAEDVNRNLEIYQKKLHSMLYIEKKRFKTKKSYRTWKTFLLEFQKEKKSGVDATFQEIGLCGRVTAKLMQFFTPPHIHAFCNVTLERLPSKGGIPLPIL